VSIKSHAAYRADEVAGATDTIATYGVNAWLYPAYGRNFTRHITQLRSPAPAAIPSDARWVLIDWLPEKTLHPSPEELQFYEAMRRDPRFALAYRDDYRNQAVFRRVSR
jgi:hypothetical protein